MAARSAISVEISQRDIARVKKRFEQNRGAPLENRLRIATRKAADLMKPRIQQMSPVKTGTLRKSVKARKGKFASDFGASIDALVGPTAPHAHLVIRGHRIVTPGGRYLGRSTRPNDFVERAKRMSYHQVVDVVREEAFV